MASNESLVLAAWVTRLSVPNAFGGYVYNLTTTGDVRLGSPTQTAARESVFVDNPTIEVLDHAQGQVLVRMSVEIVGHVGATGNIPGTQMRACADLWSDIKKATYADRTLGLSSLVRNSYVTGGILQEGGNYRVRAIGVCEWTEAAP